MQVACLVKAKLDVETECRRFNEGDGTASEDLPDTGRPMDLPLIPSTSTFDCYSPLAETGLLAQVNLLPLANQTDHNAPTRNPRGELDKILGLGSTGFEPSASPMLVPNLLGVKGALCLIEHEYVLGRDSFRVI
jgi:hypothetical protein